MQVFFAKAFLKLGGNHDVIAFLLHGNSTELKYDQRKPFIASNCVFSSSFHLASLVNSSVTLACRGNSSRISFKA